MPTCPCPSDPSVWSFVWSVVKWLFTGAVLTGIAVTVYSLLFWRRLWFTVRAFNRLPSNRAHEKGWRLRVTQSTSFFAGVWYLKDLAVPRGVGQWVFGNVAPGIPFDHILLAGQKRAAERAAEILLSGPARIVVFTGKAGWGKTYTSHTLKTCLEPLAQVDVSWTMISASPESRIVEEFLKLSKPSTAGRSASLSFEHLEMLSRRNRAATSPHFFAHVHDFEAIAIESQALASARGLIERVGDSPHISLVITTRHDQGSLGKLLPILSASSMLVRFIPIEDQLSDDDIRRLMAPERPVSDDVRPLSPLQLTLLRYYDEHTKERTRPDSSGGGPTSGARPSPSDIPGMYRELFSYLKPAHQVCLQLLLARLVVSPERLFVRDPDQLLARLGDGHPLLRLFAYVDGEGEGNPVARLAHPTVLALYTNDDIMSATTRGRRHEQWAEALGATNTDAPFARLQRVRHELRAQRGRAEHEEEITSVTHGGTLTICRFLFESRSDFQEYFPGPSEGGPDSASTILLLHDTTEDHETYVKEYVRVVNALALCSPSTVMWAVRTMNLVKMMELLYQGLDAWEAANTLANHLKGFGEGGLTYGTAMNAVFEFDYNGKTPAAIESSHAAFRALEQGPRLSPFTRATMLINEGIFRNNHFRVGPEFDEAGRFYQEAEDLIAPEMTLEPRREYRLLMLRELLRVRSGQLRWTYLKDGASVDVAGAWRDARELVERQAGWPMATPLQEFAYFALNASFIELAREGPTREWHKYYEQAKNHQEAAGDTWFRLRLDQMAVFEETLYRGARRRHRGVRRHQDRLRALRAVIAEMLEISDWTGIAFCAYQMEVMQEGKVDEAGVKSRYEEYVNVKADADRSFEKRLDRERLFAILCGDDVVDKRRYFPAWTPPESPSPMPLNLTPMPLNLHGLLLVRSVSLLDQVNWRPARG